MQVLTGQYPTIYMHKFRIDYTDFQPSTLKFLNFNFLTVPRATQVVFTQIKTITPFAGTNITGAGVYIHQSSIPPTAATTNGAFLSINLMNLTGDYIGTAAWTQSRVRATGTPNFNIIGDMVNSWSLLASLNLTGTGNINSLTAGSFYIWVGTIKTP